MALLWERGDESPGAAPVLVCHDDIVVECDVEQVVEARAWLERAMVEGTDAVLNSVGEEHVPVEVESRVAESWGEG